MQKGLIRKGLVFSIIVLFIGVGIQPALADESISIISDKEGDCIECQVSDGYSHLKANLLLTRVKTINNFISILSGEDEELILDSPPTGRPLCDYLYSLFEKFKALKIYYSELYFQYFENGYLTLSLIFLSLSISYQMAEYWVDLLYKALLC